MRNSFKVAVLMFCILMMGIAPAQAGILEFFFPSLRNLGPDPAQTLQAPFATPKQGPVQQGQPPQAKAAPLPENYTPLDLAHRNSEQIAEWLVMTVSEALTFPAGEYQGVLDKTSPYFTAAAKQQYIAFLDDAKMMPVLQAGQYQIRSFVPEAPLLLNEGAIDKRYRWLFEVPVMVSYMGKNVSNYKKNAQPVNQNLTLKIQVGRTVDHAEIGKDIAIETWTGTVDSGQ